MWDTAITYNTEFYACQRGECMWNNIQTSTEQYLDAVCRHKESSLILYYKRKYSVP